MDDLIRVNATALSLKGSLHDNTRAGFYMSGEFINDHYPDNVQISLQKENHEFLFGLYDEQIGNPSDDSKKHFSIIKELKLLHEKISKEGGGIEGKLEQLNECIELINNLFYSKHIAKVEDVWRKNSFAGLLIYDMKAALLSTGNCTAYVLRNGGLQELAAYGRKNEKLIKLGVTKNDKVKRLSKHFPDYADYFSEDTSERDVFQLAEGDVVLLCSGLFAGNIGEESINSILQENLDTANMANKLVSEARANGWNNDATILVVKIEHLNDDRAKFKEARQNDIPLRKQSPNSGKKQSRGGNYTAAVFSCILIALLIFGAYVVWDNREGIMNAVFNPLSLSTENTSEESGKKGSDDTIVQDTAEESRTGSDLGEQAKDDNPSRQSGEVQADTQENGEKPDTKEQQTVTGDVQEYTIQSGDSLQRISKKFYNDITKYEIIMKYNNISNPNDLKIGQILKIPPLESSSGN